MHAHPCLIMSGKILINLIIKYGFVPNDFGEGTLVPLLKGSNVDVS